MSQNVYFIRGVRGCQEKRKTNTLGFFFFFFWFCSSSEPVSEADKVRRRICDHVTGNVKEDRRQHYFMSVGHVHLITLDMGRESGKDIEFRHNYLIFFHLSYFSLFT